MIPPGITLGLGTVQFGLPYGVSNALGKVPPAEVRAILSLAAAQGVGDLDTAADYGDSEAVLGECLPRPHPFRLVTKTSGIRTPRLAEDAIDEVVRHFHRSLQRLGQASVEGLLVHHAGDLLAENGGRFWERLVALRDAGFVRKIGVSVYNPDELRRITAVFAIDLVQLPINVFDQRFLADGFLARVKAAGVEVHGRSVFLQGLLLMEESELPPRLAPLAPAVRAYRDFLRAHALTPMQGALRFAGQIPEVDCWMVGVCGAAQLRELLDARPAADAPRLAFGALAVADEALINPANWNS